MLADLAEQDVDDPEDDAVDEDQNDDDQTDDGDETSPGPTMATSDDATTRPFFGRHIGSSTVDRWRPAVVLATESDVSLWASRNHLVKRSTSEEQVLYRVSTTVAIRLQHVLIDQC